MANSNSPSADEIGKAIVDHSRDARFAETSMDEWRDRLTALISAQAGISNVSISNVRRVGEAAGGSNGTLLFDAEYTEQGSIIKRGLVLRFLPAEGLFHEYRLDAQFNLQKVLANTDVPVPEQLWLDDKGEYLVSPGYVMAQVEGLSPPMVWKTDGLIADAEPEVRRQITRHFVQTMAKIHQLDWQGIGLGWLAQRASGNKLIAREVNWYWDALLWSKNRPYIEQITPVKDWLIANEPDDLAPVLCHGDSNLGNYMFQEGQVSAVVDWEMAFIGTPECDLSFFAISDAIFSGEPPEGALTLAEMIAEYERVSGQKLQHMDYFQLFSSYRIAVINVLCMAHFPEAVLTMVMPTLQKAITLCLDNAKAMGIGISSD